MVVQFYCPTISAEGFQFLYVVSNTVLSYLFFFFFPIVAILIEVRMFYLGKLDE